MFDEYGAPIYDLDLYPGAFWVEVSEGNKEDWEF